MSDMKKLETTMCDRLRDFDVCVSNSRQNATLILGKNFLENEFDLNNSLHQQNLFLSGVADGTQPGEVHGEIVGVPVSADKANLIQDIFNKNFIQEKPRAKRLYKVEPGKKYLYH